MNVFVKILLVSSFALLSACGGDEKSYNDYATLSGYQEPAAASVAAEPQVTMQQTAEITGADILNGVLEARNASISDLQKAVLSTRLQQMLDAGTDSNLQIALVLAANPQIRNTVVSGNAAQALTDVVGEVREGLVAIDDESSDTAYILPDTGQNLCYDAAGAIIDCAGTGQDGEFSSNPMSFTDNGNGTVTDNVTGLTWQQSDDGNRRTWQQAADYCDSLVWGESDNWRLPTPRELMGIVNYSMNDVSIDPVFIDAKSSYYYWTASSAVNSLSRAWIVDFEYGRVWDTSTRDYSYVRCVQDATSPDVDFIDNGNGTVTDNLTGLIWQQIDEGTRRTWQNAIDYCDNLIWGDSESWRLPNIKELESIVDRSSYNPSIDSLFHNTQTREGYWSSTSSVAKPDYSWAVSFSDGDSGFAIKVAGLNVRCVRSSSIPTVTSLTGRVWMDRNLGASRVATAFDDAEAFGDLYQWGRGTDGHEKRDSPTTATLSSSDTPGHGSFITAHPYPYDWRNLQNDELWQGVSGTNNPCPSGFRLPTDREWNAERATWSSLDRTGAFASPLKLVSAGGRSYVDGRFYNPGSYGLYWSSSVQGIYARHLYFYSSGASTDVGSLAFGFNVRCIKD